MDKCIMELQSKEDKKLQAEMHGALSTMIKDFSKHMKALNATASD